MVGCDSSMTTITSHLLNTPCEVSTLALFYVSTKHVTGETTGYLKTIALNCTAVAVSTTDTESRRLDQSTAAPTREFATSSRGPQRERTSIIRRGFVTAAAAN